MPKSKCQRDFHLFDYMQKMGKLIYEKSKKEGIEYGFNVCKIGPYFKIDKICKGNESCISLGLCEEGTTIGDYHTHPNRKKSVFSRKDIIHYLINKINYPQFVGGCVESDEGVKCISPKDYYAEKLYEFLVNTPRGKEIEKISEEKDEMAKKILIDYFFYHKHSQTFTEEKDIAKCIKSYKRDNDE